MALYPEVQRKAQEEIDDVIGTDRLPTLSDRGSLPYVEAIVLELLRWQPITPLNIPHATTEDDVFEGMFIPKGSVIMVNQW
jgi:cytochrome P450